MFEDQDPTVIVKSIKDLRRFLANKSRDSSHDDVGGSPVLKLSFDDATGVDNSFFCDMDSSTSGSSFVRKHQQNIAGLDIAKKIREKDAEILQYQAKVSVLEGKYENLYSMYKKERVQYDADIESYQAKQFQDKEQLAALKEEVKQLTDKEKKVQDVALRSRESSEYHRTQREKKMMERLDAQVKKIQDLEEDLKELKEVNTELEKRNREQEAEVKLYKNGKEMMEKRISTLQEQLAEFHNVKLELEMLRTKLNRSNSRSKELELRLESVKEQEKNMQMFEDTIQQLPVLQKELKKVKDENHVHKLTRINIDMLQEKLTYAQSSLENIEIRCKDLTAENATLSTLRELTEKYEVIIKKEFNLEYLPPETEFEEMIQNIKKKSEDVDRSLFELKASIESHNSSKGDQEKLVRTLKTNQERSRFESEKNAQIIKRLQRKIFLLSKERESLQNLLASYQSETTMNPSAIEQDRINHLETQLNNYKSEVTNLEEELRKAQQLPKYETKSESDAAKKRSQSASTDDAKERDELIEHLREENKDLKAQLEYYSNKGVVNPLETKVIHFLDNPLDKAYGDRKSEYDRLLEENETLKKRVQLLEQGETSDLTEKVGRKVANETSSKQFKELEEKVVTMETRNKRLIDAFKERSHQMREVTYRLTGYKVDIPQDNHYKLSSMYSESQEDFLMFQETTSGELLLLETEFSRTLDDLMESYLQRDQSYPAFLSALTLNLFNRHTTLQSSSDQEDFEGGEEEDEEMMGDEEEELIGEEEEEENEDENEEDYEENIAGPSAKRPRREMEDDEDEDEEEDDEDELICLD